MAMTFTRLTCPTCDCASGERLMHVYVACSQVLDVRVGKPGCMMVAMSHVVEATLACEQREHVSCWGGKHQEAERLQDDATQVSWVKPFTHRPVQFGMGKQGSWVQAV